MKASYEHIGSGSTYRRLIINVPSFEFYWHFHQETELTFIEKGFGERIVGDCIEAFEEGDLVLIGPDLPHTWTSEGSDTGEGICRASVVQFDAGLFERMSAGLKEFDRIRLLLERSARGVCFSKAIAEDAGVLLKQLEDKQGLAWLTGFWNILDLLGGTDDYRLLSSKGYAPPLKLISRTRIAKVFQYLGQHFTEEICLKQVAGLICMTETSFSRFFRKNAGITYNAYLNDLRLAHACRLLNDHPEMSVSAVGMESGFRSSTHFNRMFLARKGCSPSMFRKLNDPGKRQSREEP